ncbi:MAG: YcxB family protein [Clostridia bacterium]|nr:YcxB family protein [Clostridia bacterium]
MEIKNTTLAEEKIFVNFQRFSARLFKKSSTANLIFNIFLAALIAFAVFVSAVAMVLAIVTGDTNSVITFALAIFFMLLLSAFRVYQNLFLPKILYKKSPLKGSVHYYVFRDEEFSVEVKSDKIETNENLKYSSLIKAYETQGEMFLFISPYQAMVISKYGFSSENDIKAVREKLSSLLGNKYITVK